jgi:hypothetical protein
MDKHCKDCNNKLVIGDNWTDARKKACNYTCKDCAKKLTQTNSYKKRHSKYVKRYYNKNKPLIKTRLNNFWQSKKDGEYKVYVVDNYAGMTNCAYRRRQEHGQLGKNINTFRILYSTPHKQEALELEALLHAEGYEGKA